MQCLTELSLFLHSLTWHQQSCTRGVHQRGGAPVRLRCVCGAVPVRFEFVFSDMRSGAGAAVTSCTGSLNLFVLFNEITIDLILTYHYHVVYLLLIISPNITRMVFVI